MKKYIAMILACIIMVSIFLFYSNSSEAKVDDELYKDDWAFHNYGQDIEGSIGTKGLDINILPVWDELKDQNEITVAVVDTGVDDECYILMNKLEEGWDFYNDDDTLYDEYIYDYHGTYISGVIAKTVPNVNIIPVKFMESTSGSIDDAVESIEYAIENGAKIINCSWNYYDYNIELYDVISKHPDVLFVSAAGNYNANLEKVSIYPCSYELDNIINVMAIDNTGKVHDTSGYGKETIDIAAPGENVLVYFPENNETFISGTSVATAFVTSAAAILLSEDESLSPSEIKEILISSAQHVEGLEDKCVSGGMLDIYEALMKIK